MRELIAGVGIMAMCLVGSMEAGGRAAMPPPRDEISIPAAVIDADDRCIHMTVWLNTVISNDEEAARVCGPGCETVNGEWDGTWHTSIGGNNSFCGCRVCTAAE